MLAVIVRSNLSVARLGCRLYHPVNSNLPACICECKVGTERRRDYTISSGTNNRAINQSSTGSRILKEHTLLPFQSLKWRSKEQLADELLQNILYKDDYIVALNKPNGVPMHSLKYDEHTPLNVASSEKDANNLWSLADVKPILQKQLGVSDLHEVFSQNRLYSGVIVFSFTADVQKMLSLHFRDAKVNSRFITTYQTLCLNGPRPSNGTEEIPIVRQLINNAQMSIRAEKSVKNARKAGLMICPTVKYSTMKTSRLSYDCHCSLVEILPSATKWDCLELFLLHKHAPILGDHRYSSRLKTILDKRVLVLPSQALPEPQDIPVDICKLLDLPENQTSIVPLHLHCSKLIIPQVGVKKKNMLKISAPLPDFFKKSFASLKLETPPTENSSDGSV